MGRRERRFRATPSGAIIGELCLDRNKLCTGAAFVTHEGVTRNFAVNFLCIEPLDAWIEVE